MTTFAPDDLLLVLEALTPALKSIDVRTVAVRPPSEEHWQNLVTSIIMSDKTVEEVNAEHQQLVEVRNPNNQFVILMNTYAFNYQVFDEISNGKICFFTPFGRNIVKTRAFNPLALKVTSTQEWFEDSACYVLKAYGQGVMEEKKDYWEIEQKQNTFAKRFGFPNTQQLIQHYLELNNSSYGMVNDFELTIQPLVKIIGVQFSENQLNVTVENNSEIEGLQLNVILKRNYKSIWRNTYEIKGTENSIECSISGMLPLDVLDLELIHRKSYLTLDRTDKKVTLENVAEPFVKTLDAFCSLAKLKKMLFEPEKYGKNPTKIFENAVTWLLSLSGFDALPLGITIKLPTGKEESFDELHEISGYHIGSADIIAYEENGRIILIDCDINTVEQKKVDKLAELKKHFRETLKGYEKLPIVPILFTPKDFRDTPPSFEVMIADKAVIKRIFEAVVKGDREHARSILYYSGF